MNQRWEYWLGRARRWGMAAAVAGSLAGAVFFMISGCTEPTREGGPGIDPRDLVTHPMYPALQGTVGEVTGLGTAQSVHVEGYGIVAGLPHTGSGDMPANVRAILTEQLYKEGAGSTREGTQNINPRMILESDQIAVVEVRGLVPPMASKGTHFDLSINALPGTGTTSLEGGLLWTCNLKLIGLADETDTRTIAQGRGPVYCQPLAPEAGGDMTHRPLRRARVMGGGQIMIDMPNTLQTFSPSYGQTAIVQRVVNSHFPRHTQVATAQNDSLISLNIPDEYKENPGDFIDLVMHMYTGMDAPGFVDNKAPELIRALGDPAAPHKEIAVALQGLGRTIIEPYLRPQYVSRDPEMRFWTAKAGAMLQDTEGELVLEDFARDRESPLRLAAIDAIAQVGRMGEVERTTSLLAGTLINDPDNRVRLAAYQALRIMRSGIIRAFRVKRFDIDVVPSDGPTLIYATQGARERIAMIGHDFDLAAGTFYVSNGSQLTLNVPVDLPAAGAMAPVANGQPARPVEPVLLYFRGGSNDRSVALNSTTHLGVILARLGYEPDPKDPNYDAKQQYIGLPYQKAVEMVSALCREKAINATLVMQPTPPGDVSATDLAEDARPEGFVLTATTQPTTQASVNAAGAGPVAQGK